MTITTPYPPNERRLDTVCWHCGERGACLWMLHPLWARYAWLCGSCQAFSDLYARLRLRGKAGGKVA